MSSTTWNVPTLFANACSMRTMLDFIYAHEKMLNQHGAIKIILPTCFVEHVKVRRCRAPLPSTFQRVTRTNDNQLFYSVTTMDSTSVNSGNHTSPLDNITFWHELAHIEREKQLSSVSTLQGTSFFLKRTYQDGFDIARMSAQSFTRLRKGIVPEPITPTLIRMHGPGAITPLASTRQRLPSFVYHHEGGARYWYVIPAREREALDRLLEQSSQQFACIDHGRILIDPAVLKMHRIAHGVTAQQPNEIVVLAAGALTQSFSADGNWTESIEFAMPTWFTHGHADTQSMCMCEFHIDFAEKRIDTSPFRHLLSEKTSKAAKRPFDFDTDEEDRDAPTRSVVNGRICRVDNDNGDRANQHYRPLDALMDFAVPLAEDDEPTSSELWNHSDHRRSMSQTTEGDLATDSSIELQNALVQPDSDSSCRLYIDQVFSVDVPLENTVQTMPPPSTEERIDQQPVPVVPPPQPLKQHFPLNKHSTPRRFLDRTIYVCNLNINVTKAILYNYFPGAIKVIIKQSCLPPYMHYAFIAHLSRFDAQRNLNIILDPALFGSEARMTLANRPIDRTSENHIYFSECTVVIRRIPEHVPEELLRSLFPRCEHMRYIPAHRGLKHAILPNATAKYKRISGYAFVHFPNHEDAIQVVQNANRYQIFGKPLSISWFDPSRSHMK